MSTLLPPAPELADRILVLRGQRVMLDIDLAYTYGVETRAFNQAIKRNQERFPADFMFQLSEQEKTEVITNCEHLNRLKYSPHLPYAFTEHGAIMAASMLKSERAVEMSVFVVRAFVRMREVLVAHQELASKLDELERKVGSHDQALAGVIDALRQLMNAPASSTRPIGFTANLDAKKTGK